MEFPIADIFTESLARLTGDEQKAVKTTAVGLQMKARQSELAVPQTHAAMGIAH